MTGWHELDAVVISDIHLGSDNCQADQLVEFLEQIHSRELPTRRLIINGDVFDSIDFRRLRKSHWKVLSLLRKLSNDIEVVWVIGNHDGPAEIVSFLLGVLVVDEFEIETGRDRMLFLHGDRFDKFIRNFPVTTWIGDTIYRFLQKVDRSHSIAKLAKRRSKIFLRCLEKIQRRAIRYASQRGCQIVACGHTHQATAAEDGRVRYYNSGCWTEKPCHYLTVDRGDVEVHSFPDRVRRVPGTAAATTEPRPETIHAGIPALA